MPRDWWRNTTHCLKSFTLKPPLNRTLLPPTPLLRHAKEKHHIHDLPPAERLEKYYQFLTQLNDLIAQQNEQLLSCEESTQLQQLIEKVKITEQRKQRCLDAIDNLEEYLLFVAERDKS